MPRRSSKKKMTGVRMVEFDEKKWGMTAGEMRKGLELFNQDLDWYYSNQTRLRKRYLRQWIVVQGKKVVMADESYERLLSKLRDGPKGYSRAKIFYVDPAGNETIY
jgi:hypothetical protein